MKSEPFGPSYISDFFTRIDAHSIKQKSLNVEIKGLTSITGFVAVLACITISSTKIWARLFKTNDIVS